MPLMDRQTLFCEGMAVSASATTVTVTSTDTVDLGPIGDNTALTLGASRTIFHAHVETALASTGAALVTINLVTDDNTGLTSTSLIWTSGSMAVSTMTAGRAFNVDLPYGAIYKRYLAMQLLQGTHVLSAGTMTAALQGEAGDWRAYAADQKTLG